MRYNLYSSLIAVDHTVDHIVVAHIDYVDYIVVFYIIFDRFWWFDSIALTFAPRSVIVQFSVSTDL